MPYVDACFTNYPDHDIYGDFQNLVAGKMTPDAFLADIQAGWVKFHKSLK